MSENMASKIMGATLTVAATDAPNVQKVRADYLCDGTADEVQINAAIAALPATGGSILLSEGIFTTAATITLDPYTDLILNTGTKIVPTGNYNVVSVGKYCTFSGGCIDTSAVGGYTSAAVYLDCTNQYLMTNTTRVTRIHDIQLVGADSLGRGIYFDATAAGGGDWATGICVDNVNIYRFEDGVRLEVVSPGVSHNFINGNNFNRVYVTYADYAFRLIGSNAVPFQCVGNIFWGCQVQAAATSLRAIYCEGANNIWEGLVVWDWPLAVIGIEFTAATGHTNRIRGFLPCDTGMTDDNGIRNNVGYTTEQGFLSAVGTTVGPVIASTVGTDILPDPQIAVPVNSDQKVLVMAHVRITSSAAAVPAIILTRTGVPIGKVAYGSASETQTVFVFTVDTPGPGWWTYGISWGNVAPGVDNITAEGTDRELYVLVQGT